MDFIILPSYKLLKGLPARFLNDIWNECIRMAHDLACFGKINDPFLSHVDNFPVDDLVMYAKFVEGAMYNCTMGCDPHEFNQWLFPTNKRDARYRLTYKNCKRYGLKRRDKRSFQVIEAPFSDLYGTGLIFNEPQTWKFMSYMWVNNGICDYEWDKFCELYNKLKE